MATFWAPHSKADRLYRVTLITEVNQWIALPKRRGALSFVAVKRIGPPPHTGPCVSFDQGSLLRESGGPAHNI
jgi:hypothetical protein